ncbi:MAG: winged helix-turn-helix domain-containing protein [Candidatus Hodarchaeales archaeon]|jgi:DNA-binding transcriptional ArsR family regulator
MLNEKIFDFLDTQTKALIFWNLIVKKELTAKQIANSLKKDISTILRTLNKLETDKIVIISRTETKRNFNLNYWKLNPEILKIDFSNIEKTIYDYISSDKPDPEIILRVSMFLKAFQAVITSILHFKVQKILSEEKQAINWLQSDIFSALLVNDEIGQIFHNELFQFLENFVTKYKTVNIPLNKIKESGYIYFLFGSKIKDSIP